MNSELGKPAIISPDEIQRFFTAAGAPAVCHVCGTPALMLIESNAPMQFTIHSQPLDGGMVIGGNSNVPVIMLGCNKCFAIRMHAYLPIAEWLRASKSESAK